MAHGLRFSLRGILTAVALAAVAMALWVSYRTADENKRLRAENTRLRNESGQLTIEPGDEQKVHAIKVATLDSYTWRWRVYAPQDRAISLRLTNESTYGDGKPAGSGASGTRLSPGETLITLGLRRSPKGQWEWVMQETDGAGSGEGRSGITLNAKDAELLTDNNTSSASGVYQTTTSVDPGSDLELLNLKISTSAGGGITESLKVTIHDGGL